MFRDYYWISMWVITTTCQVNNSFFECSLKELKIKKLHRKRDISIYISEKKLYKLPV